MDHEPSRVTDLIDKINSNRDAHNVINSLRREQDAEEDYRGDDNDHFPAFTRRLRSTTLPEKPLRISKYLGKQDPIEWLRCYTLAVQATGGGNDTQVIYFLVCMDPAPLT